MMVFVATVAAVSLVAGWQRSLSGVPFGELAMIAGCFAAALLFGLSAEVGVLAIRLRESPASRWRLVVRIVLTEVLLALGAGFAVGAVLSLPVLDSLRFDLLALMLSLSVFILAIALEATLLARGGAGSSLLSHRSWSAWAATCTMSNALGLAIAILAGRAYLWIFYPGVG